MATPTVLVLDLDSPRFKFLSWFLAQEGLPTYHANSVDEAVKLLAEKSVDAVVVNAVVPAPLVSEVVNIVHARQPEAVVVAYEVDEVPAPVLAIPRPVDVDDVIQPLRHYFDG